MKNNTNIAFVEQKNHSDQLSVTNQHIPEIFNVKLYNSKYLFDYVLEIY